jgi:hypothetical protein
MYKFILIPILCFLSLTIFAQRKNKTGKKIPSLSGYVKYDRSNPEHIEDSIALVKAITDAPIVIEGHVGLGNIDSYEPCVRDRAGNCYNSQIIEVTKVYKGEGIQAGDLLEMHLQKDCKIYTEPIGYDMRYKQYYCWEDYYYHSQDISLFFLHKSEMPINIKNQPIKTTVNYFSQCPISFIRDRMRNLRFETHDNFLTYFYSYPWVKKYLKKKSKKNQK